MMFKRNKVIFTLLLAGVFSCVASFAQESDNDQMASLLTSKVYFPFSIEAGGNLWYPLSNFALKDNFGGVYFAHASVQHSLTRNLYGGIELQNGQISEVTPVTYRVAIATTNLFFYNAGLRVSYYSSETNDWFFSATIVGGLSMIAFNKLPAGTPAPANKQVVFVSPRICESLKVNDELRIGLELAYSYYGYTFNPVEVGITPQVHPYTTTQTTGPLTFLGWGFNLTYFLGKPKS